MHRINPRWRLLMAALLGLQSFALASLATRQVQASGAVDVAAVTLRPGDVAQPGWVHDGAFVEGLDGEARSQAAYLGRGTTAAEVAQRLTAVGWRRLYLDVLILPSPANPNAPLARIRSSVTDYATAEGAAAGFTYLEDVSTVVSAKIIPATRIYGEQSEMTSDRGVSSIDGRLSRSLDLTFRVGTLVADVTLIVYPSKTATTPDQATLEALGAIMEGRVLNPPAEGAGLGREVSRLNFPNAAVISYDDAYYRIGGTDIPISGETTTAAARRVLTYKDATDVYQLWQGVDVGSSSGVLYGVTLLHFPSDLAAATWVMNLQTVLGENPFYAQMGSVPNVEAMGDQVLALSYTAGGGADTPRALLIAVRVGSEVARVHVVPQGRLADVPPAPVEALANAEARCLQGKACADVIELPPDLTAAVPAATPTASLPVSPIA